MQQLIDILSSLGFNWHIALANFVNFLIIFFLLKHFVFGKVEKVLDERKRHIEKGLEDAEVAKTHLFRAEEERKAKVEEGEKEASKLLELASEKAHAVADEIRARGEKEASLVLAQAHAYRESVEQEVEKAFAKKAPKLVADLIENALVGKVDKESNNAFTLKGL